jgi:sigma-B regulation protein RsbU (phosphoserine phosphatase)
MAIKILCVDDEPDWEFLIKQKFRKRIRSNEFVFLFALNGKEALQLLDLHDDIEIVISDINMPVMDGLTLLDEIIQLKRPFLKVIIVSAYGDMENIRTAMNRGAFDFLTKPIDFKDLEITIEKTINNVSFLKKADEEHKNLVAIQQDLITAKKIQQSFIPNKFPAFPGRKDIEIYGSMNAAKNVGGDLYDFFLIDDHKIGFVIGDISGKGVPAALFMAMSRSVIKTIAMKGKLPDQTMKEANEVLLEESQDAMFITTFYGILNTRTGHLQYTNAGHAPPLILFKNGPVSKLDGTENVALAAFDDINYNKRTFILNKGDAILLFTDGVTEALNEKGEEYGMERLAKLLENSGNLPVKDIIRKIMDDIKKFMNNTELTDDLTMLAFRYHGK